MHTLNKTALALWFSTLPTFVAAESSDPFDQLDQATTNTNRPKEEIYQEFRNYVDRYLDEYETWRANYTRELDAQRKNLIDKWGSAELSDSTIEVEYQTEQPIRTVRNYEENSTTVSILLDGSINEAQAKKLLIEQIHAAGAQVNEEKITVRTVDYSSEQEQREKAFVLEQTYAQMNEYDIQAEQLISARIGVPDDFIYQRAYRKKMALIEEAKQRMAAIGAQYQQQRTSLRTALLVSAESETTKTPSASLEPEVELKTSQDASVLSVTGKSDSKPQTIAKNQPDSVPAKPSAAISQTQNDNTVDATGKNEQKAIPTAKKVISYKLRLPNNALTQRASEFQPMVLSESEKWSVDPALVMAIMHSESAFRPKAKSHVPAYGLMQIVPTTAGHDINRRVREIDAPMKEDELYQPPVNIETGTAYLHLLDSTYLKSIRDPKSRMYCTIAAYNTGAGNVARAFNRDRSTNIRKASTVINQLEPQEVYDHLMQNLPYDETKNYLKKVSSRIALYQTN
ncbi:transglycosylase SLT domain-containing protein [Vibrio cidicii]|nr:transglycosylase SLT domain-containing protein [Vibrio cidicii]